MLAHALFFAFPGTFPARLVSSNGRHLKSFLYPPHVTDRLAHCWQVGFVSSHLSRFALHVMHPTQTSRSVQHSSADKVITYRCDS